MKVNVVGLFLDLESAVNPVGDLIDAGFPKDSISFVSKGREPGVAPGDQEPPASETIEDTMAGLVGGGLAGLAIGLTSILVPGFGVLVAAGPLALALSGGAIGGTTGAVIGSIRDLGLTQEETDGYMASLDAGARLVVVHTTDDRTDEASNILRNTGASDVHVVADGESG